jgi:hypothetical protein
MWRASVAGSSDGSVQLDYDSVVGKAEASQAADGKTALRRE